MSDDGDVIIDLAVYTKGVRRPGRLDLVDAFEAASEPDSFVWLGLHEPALAEFEAAREEFGLHELAVEDAVKAHQRPKLEVYDDDLFVVLKTARYDDLAESVRFSELLIFVGATYVVTVRHGEASPLTDVRAKLEGDPARLASGPMAVLHAVIDHVVDDYTPVIEGLDNDMVEIEAQVFEVHGARRVDPSRRIYQLKRQVLELLRTTEPFMEPLHRLATGQVPRGHAELHTYFRDVEDHLTRVVSAIRHERDLLTDALDANLAQVTTLQNNDMRTISAWVAIGGIPTVIGAIYGMNFDTMPELHWRYGYLFVVVLMAVLCVGLYRRFKRIGWL